MEEISRPELQRFYYRREKLFRVRLVIALPLIFAILAAIPSFLCVSIIDNVLSSYPDLYSSQQIRNTMITLQMVTVASVAFAILCGILFSNLLTAPLKKLSDLLLDMAEKGRIEPMNIQLGDEIAILGESYNRMVMSMSKYLPERARFVFHNLASGVITYGFESGIVDTINSAADKTSVYCGGWLNLFQLLWLRLTLPRVGNGRGGLPLLAAGFDHADDIRRATRLRNANQPRVLELWRRLIARVQRRC